MNRATYFVLLPVLVSGSIAAACGSSGNVTGGTSSGSGGKGGSFWTTSSSSGSTTSTSSGATASASTSTSSSGGEGGSSSSSSGAGGSGGAGGFGTIFTILLENHDYNEIVGNMADAPYINSLIKDYALATNYYDSGTHPSLPNYLYLISGDTQYPGVVDVNPDWVPYFPSSADNLGNQMQGAGVQWRSYQESMGMPCTLDSNGNYAPRHDPFLYFDDIQNGPNGLCALRNVDYTQFPGDLAAGTYKYMWITPNLLDDGHDPQNDPVAGLQQADAWLSSEVPKILASDAWKNGGVLFITWDEAEGRNGDDPDKVPMIVVSPKLKSKGYLAKTKFTHASYLATIEDIFGLPRLGAAVGAPNLMEFFQ